MIKKSQKGLPASATPKALQAGVSLIMTFFIMVIILTVVLSISVILYSEVKVITNVGNSVASYYAAESGAEKVLYYDRQVIPAGAERGICNICTALNACAPNTPITGCDTCSATPNSLDGCTNCTDCHIVFATTMTTTPQKYYNAVVDVSTSPQLGLCPLYTENVESYGTYINTTRAININFTGEVKTGLGPGMGSPQAIINGNGKITISVTLSPYPDCKQDTVKAYIYDQSDGTLVDTVSLTASGQCNFSRPWNGGQSGHTYYISLGTIDANGLCASVMVNPS